MPWHESIIESELSKTRVLVNATSIGLHGDETPIPGELLPPDLLVLDLIYRRTKLLRDAIGGRRLGRRRRDDAPPPGGGGVHAVDRPAGAARADAGEAPGSPGRWDRVGRGRADRRAGGRLAGGSAPVPDGRRVPRPRPRGDRRGRSRRADADGRSDRDRPRPAPAGLRSRRPPGHRAGPGRDRLGASATGVTLGSPILLEVANRDWENWTRVMQVEPLTRRRRGRAARRRGGRPTSGPRPSPGSAPVTPTWPVP